MSKVHFIVLHSIYRIKLNVISWCGVLLIQAYEQVQCYLYVNENKIIRILMISFLYIIATFFFESQKAKSVVFTTDLFILYIVGI
jgi:hypothetical protein